VWVTSKNNSSLVELDGKDLHVVSTMLVDSPSGIAIWQDKGMAYVTNQDYDTVTEIDLVAHTITRKIKVGSQPLGVTVEQTTGDVFVANNGSGDVSCIPSNGAPVTSTANQKVVLYKPTRLIGFRYSDAVPGAAIVVDSSGQVAIVAITNPASGSTNTIRNIAAITNACVIAQIATINKDALADVDQSSSTDPITFYVSDIDGKSVVLVPLSLYTARELSVTPTYTQITLPESPYAVTTFMKCVGAVVPDQNLLYLLDPALKQILGQKKIGKQGDNGGWGLAYNPDNETAYVANPAANSVTRIASPCQ
jgi:YVTN family beta-propeller protein